MTTKNTFNLAKAKQGIPIQWRDFNTGKWKDCRFDHINEMQSIMIVCDDDNLTHYSQYPYKSLRMKPQEKPIKKPSVLSLLFAVAVVIFSLLAAISVAQAATFMLKVWDGNVLIKQAEFATIDNCE